MVTLQVGDIFYIKPLKDILYEVLPNELKDKTVKIQVITGPNKGLVGYLIPTGNFILTTHPTKEDIILRKIAVMEKRFINKRSK